MTTIGTGVIGAGTFGQWHVRAYAELERTKLVAVADADENKAALAVKYGGELYTDYRHLLERKDIATVSICLPDHLHTEVCVAAAEAGKHILVEKPLATSEEDAQKIIAAVTRNGVRLMVDFANRWSPPFLAARRGIESGEIGRPAHAYMKLNDTLEVPTNMLSWSAASSVAWFLGSHCVDLLRWLLQDEVVKLRAVARSVVLKGMGIDTPDFFQTVLEFASGSVVHLENSWILPKGNATVFEFAADIVGSAGRYQIDTAQHGCLRQTTDRTRHLDVLMFNELEGKIAGFGIKPLEHFVSCLQEDTPFAVSIDDALKAVKLVAAIEESAKTDQVIKMV